MEVRIDEVDGLPAHTYLSIRYGEQRRQAPFRTGEVITFPPATGGAAEKAPRSYTVDVLRKVGSKQVSLAGIAALGGSVKSAGLEIPSLEINGTPITADLSATMVRAKPEEQVEQPKRQQIARKAKEYLDAHGVQPVLNDMFARLLEAQPTEPLAFMVDFLEQQRESQATEAEGLRSYASVPGLGATPLPGFADGRSSEDLPDLAQHCSLAADVLRSRPEVYERLRDTRTELGVSLAQCAKPGIDCPGHALMKVAGAFAGDAQCYEMYWDFFRSIVCSLHPGWMPGVPHFRESNPAKLTNSRIDGSGRYAVCATLDARRNFQSLRFPTCCSKAERREVEQILTSALAAGADGPPSGRLRGAYLPLRSSESHAAKRGGMTLHQQQRLRIAGMLFGAPDSRMRLSAGLGRDWPDARGVFLAESQGAFIWCNEEDHLRFFARQHHAVDLKRLWRELQRSISAVDAVAVSRLRARGGLGVAAESAFARSDHLGYVTTCPTRLGAALRATVTLKIPLLAAAADLSALCSSMDLLVSHEVGHSGGVWNVSTGDCLGLSEVDVINNIIEGCVTLVSLEQRLERGEPIFEATLGLGVEAAPGFPRSRCPPAMPDVSRHQCIAAEVLRVHPQIYAKLRKKATAGGVSFATCIKPGMDDEATRASGVVAGDANCFTAFRAMFDPVIQRLNGDFLPTVPQPRDTSCEKVTNCTIKGHRSVRVLVEIRRNLRGLRFAPSCSQDERREVERLVVKALLSLDQPREACYLPLSHSQSYAPMPGGVSEEEERGLRSSGLLFDVPSRREQLSAGVGRQWPDARGAFLCGEGADFVAWVGEEDHVRLRVQREGGDVKVALARALALEAELSAALERLGSGFAFEERLGFLTVDPAHLGPGLHCAVDLRLPLVSMRPELEELVASLDLRIEAAGTPGDGSDAAAGLATRRVGTGPNLGVSEVDVANGLIDGCARLAGLEDALAAGGIEAEEQLRELLLR